MTHARAGVRHVRRRVDELRQQLRALGYLDAGVDRFVLGPAQATRARCARGAAPAFASACWRRCCSGRRRRSASACAARPGQQRARRAGPRGLSRRALLPRHRGARRPVSACWRAAFVRAGGERSTQRAQRASRLAAWSTTIACLAYLTLWWRAPMRRSGGTRRSGRRSRSRRRRRSACCSATPSRITTLAVLGGGDARVAAAGLAHDRGASCSSAARSRSLGGAALLILTAPAAADARVRPTADRRVQRHARPARRHRRLRPTMPTQPLRRADRRWTAARRHRADARSRRTRSDPARAWTTIATGVPAGRARRARASRRGGSPACRARSAPATSARRARRPRGDRSAAADAAVDRQPRGTAREDGLGSRRRRRAAHRGGQLVGDVAGARQQRHRPHRSRRAAARARRPARRGDRAGRALRAAAQAWPEFARALRRSRGGASARIGRSGGRWRSCAVPRSSTPRSSTCSSVLPEPRRDLDVDLPAGARHRAARAARTSQSGALPPSAMAARIDGLARLLSLSRRARLRRCCTRSADRGGDGGDAARTRAKHCGGLLAIGLQGTFMRQPRSEGDSQRRCST